MSDNIPFEIQIEIIESLPVKSLIRFRSVSKAWKSLIDSSDFITHYSRQQQHLLVRYDDDSADNIERKYVSIVDDDTFPQHKVTLTTPLLFKNLSYFCVVGISNGLFCLHARHNKAVLWNPSIRKAVDVVVPRAVCGILFSPFLGFGVCPVTNDPKILKIRQINRDRSNLATITSIPWQVEVFTLSTRAWRSPYSNLPRKSIQFQCVQVVVDGFLYWLATDMSTIDDEFRSFSLIISFDLTSEEFGEIKLPCSLACRFAFKLSMSKLRESLVVLEHSLEDSKPVFNVWMMENGVSKSFTNLFTVRPEDAFVINALEFRKSGEPILEVEEDHRRSLVVYEPYSNHIDKLGINGIGDSFSMYPYMETLLLHDQPDMTFNDDMES